jgi:hypothetical protein
MYPDGGESVGGGWWVCGMARSLTIGPTRRDLSPLRMLPPAVGVRGLKKIPGRSPQKYNVELELRSVPYPTK